MGNVKVMVLNLFGRIFFLKHVINGKLKLEVVLTVSGFYSDGLPLVFKSCFWFCASFPSPPNPGFYSGIFVGFLQKGLFRRRQVSGHLFTFLEQRA